MTSWAIREIIKIHFTRICANFRVINQKCFVCSEWHLNLFWLIVRMSNVRRECRIDVSLFPTTQPHILFKELTTQRASGKFSFICHEIFNFLVRNFSRVRIVKKKSFSHNTIETILVWEYNVQQIFFPVWWWENQI